MRVSGKRRGIRPALISHCAGRLAARVATYKAGGAPLFGLEADCVVVAHFNFQSPALAAICADGQSEERRQAWTVFVDVLAEPVIAFIHIGQR